MWKCKCECGGSPIVSGRNLRTGNSKSCGCTRYVARRGPFKHGEGGTRLYKIWACMKSRCLNSKDVEKFKLYGGRGITVCNEWSNDYMVFRNWALSNRYAENLTIDRIDNNGNYCPENCRWIPHKEQCMNRRSNHWVTENGETLSILQWANKLGVSHSLIITRLKNGGSVYDGVENPLAPNN